MRLLNVAEVLVRLQEMRGELYTVATECRSCPVCYSLSCTHGHTLFGSYIFG